MEGQRLDPRLLVRATPNWQAITADASTRRQAIAGEITGTGFVLLILIFVVHTGWWTLLVLLVATICVTTVEGWQLSKLCAKIAGSDSAYDVFKALVRGGMEDEIHAEALKVGDWVYESGRWTAGLHAMPGALAV